MTATSLGQSAQRVQQRLGAGQLSPGEFRAALLAVPATERDAWVDLVLGVDPLAEDGPDLPRGCVPYLPCSVEVLLDLVDRAKITSEDIFVDVGAGVGRAAFVVHLLTGAMVRGIEVQPQHVRAACELAERWRFTRCVVQQANAVVEHDILSPGTVFFLYCPFSAARATALFGALEQLSRSQPLRLGCVDMPLEPVPAWLEPLGPRGATLEVYRSTPG